MSYSRWTKSRWYTLWNAAFPLSRDEAMFQITAVTRFEAHKIRNSIDDCIAVVRQLDPEASDVELDELKSYMLEFLVDVDAEYPQ